MPRILSADEARPLDLEQQRKLAKELRAALAHGDTTALARFRASHPKAASRTDAQIVADLSKLTEAQFVIARELGVRSWPRLRAHIERYAIAREEIEAGAAALDDDIGTTHIRCGSDIRDGLRAAGFRGRFVEFSDPYCQGPVPREGDLIAIRARFIAEAFDVPEAEARAGLVSAHEQLEVSLGRDRVVLWFEHDSYDQLILARILSFYAERGTPRRLELVHIDGFPAVDRFKGLGELSPVALRMLWDDREPVSSDLIGLGARVWRALREPAPVKLLAASHDSGALPRMGTAILRHLQELPWRGDGLSLTERLSLELIAEDENASAGRIFVRLNNEREPVPFLGDAMWWWMMREMLRAKKPPIAFERDDPTQPWQRGGLSLTPAGGRILAGKLDWLACGPRPRWVGGVLIEGGEKGWRWDAEAMGPRRD